MPSEASTADVQQDLAERVKELERELAEAHRREVATAEILRVLSSSPTGVHPVFEAIVESGRKLFAGAAIRPCAPRWEPSEGNRGG